MTELGNALRHAGALIEVEKPTIELCLNIRHTHNAVRAQQLARAQRDHNFTFDADLRMTLIDPCTWFCIQHNAIERETENDQTRRVRAKRRKELSELRQLDRQARAA